VATVGFGIVIWILRRPDQFLHPYVWVEEYQILNTYQTHGLLRAVLSPPQGYFIWPSSFTVGISAAVSFLHLPVIEYWLSTAWFVATLCLILVPASSLRLRWRIGIAALLMLAPMNPEIYGVALYIFWWTTLWPLISLFWSKDYWWLRIPVLIIGGMSSIAGAAMVVPYAILFGITRQRRHLVGAAVLTLTLAAQTIAYLRSPRTEQSPLHPERVAIQELRNFSDYAFTWLKPTDSDFLGLAGAIILIAILGVVAYATVRQRSSNTNELVALVIGLLIVGLLSSEPAPLIADPILAGTRYYFLPYAVLGWVLLMIAVTSELRWARVAATVLIVMSLLTLSQDFARHDDRFIWSQQLARCKTANKPFSVPVQFDGIAANMWQGYLMITPQTCRHLGYP